MSKIALIGHCGPDSSYLRMVISKAEKNARILVLEDESGLQAALTDGLDLILVNRELDYGYAEQLGVDLIERLLAQRPTLKLMLVSNHPDAQAQAAAKGALPGFGKRELGSPRVIELLKSALRTDAPAERDQP